MLFALLHWGTCTVCASNQGRWLLLFTKGSVLGRLKKDPVWVCTSICSKSRRGQDKKAGMSSPIKDHSSWFLVCLFVFDKYFFSASSLFGDLLYHGTKLVFFILFLSVQLTSFSQNHYIYFWKFQNTAFQSYCSNQVFTICVYNLNPNTCHMALN